MTSGPEATFAQDRPPDDYTRHVLHFDLDRVSPYLASLLQQQPPGFRYLDWGCGDGALVRFLTEAKLLAGAGAVIGVDVSPERVSRFRARTGHPAHVLDEAWQASPGRFHVVTNTMVLEHATDDAGLLRALANRLEPGGTLFLTTVVKRWYGVYYFRVNGRFTLDPTHVREYPDVESVLALVRGAGLEVKHHRSSLLWFPPLRLVLRLLNRFWPLAHDQSAIKRSRLLRILDRFTVPIFGFYEVEVIAKAPG